MSVTTIEHKLRRLFPPNFLSRSFLLSLIRLLNTFKTWKSQWGLWLMYDSEIWAGWIDICTGHIPNIFQNLYQTEKKNTNRTHCHWLRNFEVATLLSDCYQIEIYQIWLVNFSIRKAFTWHYLQRNQCYLKDTNI